MWLHRSILSKIAAGLLLVGLPFIPSLGIASPLTYLLVGFQSWALILPARLVFGRLPEAFLRSSTKFNCLLFGIIMLALAVGNPLIVQIDLAPLFVILSIAIATSFLVQLGWTLKHYRLHKLAKDLSMRALPTVTLAIPARNETHALAQCLQAAIASDYPKLEILVADDCSQDKTSDLIRSFAHDGVRFIQGDLPAEGWLGKNQACQILAEQALGEYIVFAGVDTHLEPQSISKMIAYVLSNNLSMVSVLPSRRDGVHLGTLLPQLRYYWQIVFPITRHRVPVASPFWMVKTDTLRKLGGFAAVRNKIMPEGSFARRLFGADLYRFIISNAELGITTAKKWSSQNDSATRLLYPTFKRQPFFVLIACLMLISFLGLPFAVLTERLLTWQLDSLFWLSALSSGLLMASYGLVVMRTHPRTVLLTSLTYPLSLLQELTLLILSMLSYEFTEVNWKGRNVCYPIIKQSFHLPPLPTAPDGYRQS